MRIEIATSTACTPQAERIHMVVAGWNDSLTALGPRIEMLERLDDVHTLIATPRYDVFRDVIFQLDALAPPLLKEIAENDEILLTDRGSHTQAIALPTDESRKRVVMSARVPDMLAVARELRSGGNLRSITYMSIR